MKDSQPLYPTSRRQGDIGMITDCTETETSNTNLFEYLKKMKCTQIQFKLLCFFLQRPKTRMGMATVSRITGIPKETLTGEISLFIDHGIISRHDIGNGSTIYALACGSDQRYCAKLTETDWSELAKICSILPDEQSGTGAIINGIESIQHTV
jgi:hypothetical protein